MTTSMQRLLILTSLFFGFFLPGFGQAPYEMLWEIRHPAQAQPSYLFGTMHISDSRVFNLPDSVILAIQNTAGMAFELDFDSTSYHTFHYLMRDGDYRLEDLDKLASRLNPPSYENIVDRVMDRLQNPEEDEPEDDKENSVLFLDAFLYRVGRDLGKVRSGLEQVEDQFRLLYGEGDQPSVLSSAKSSIRGGELTKAYLAGNLQQIEKWLETDKLFDPYARKLLLDDRNTVMARGADSLIGIRPTFIAVGAAHLPGKQGVISLLRARGYTLRPVRAVQKTGLALAAKAKPYTPHWETFRNESAGYALQVPCRPYRATFTDLPVPMYMGMDFPGGWVYYFFAFPWDMLGNNVDGDEIRSRMVSSMMESMDAEGDPYPIQAGAFKGEEAIVKIKDQYLRIRGVSDDKMLFVIFAGVDEGIVRAPMLDTMFNSLVSFPALPLTQRPWGTRIVQEGGFSADMPLEATRTAITGRPTDPNPNLYTVVYFSDDEQTREELSIGYGFCESQILPENDPLQRLMDSLLTTSLYGGTVSKQTPFTLDGYRGMEFEIDLDGTNTSTWRLLQRGDRIYFYGGTATKAQESKARIRAALDAFRLLPIQHSPLTFPLAEKEFTTRFPGPVKLYSQEFSDVDFWGSYGADSTKTWGAIDPKSGYLYYCSRADFPAWTALDSLQQLFTQFNDLVDERVDVYTRAIRVPGTTVACERLTKTLDKGSSVYIRLAMHGRSIIAIMATIADGDEASARAFADGFQFLPVPAFDWTSSKLSQIIPALEGNDENETIKAELALYRHRLDTADKALLMELLARKASRQETPDYAYNIIDALMNKPGAGDATALSDLARRFAFSPDMQTYIIGSLFYNDTLGHVEQGVTLLKELLPHPSEPYAIEDMVSVIENHFYNSKDVIALYDALDFMLLDPTYQPEFLYLTETMGAIGELEARHTGVYRARFQELAQEWIQTPQYDPTTEALKFNYDYLISALYLADPDARSLALLERIMDMGDPRVEEYAVLMLLEADHPLPKSRLIHLLEQPGYSEALLHWLWNNDQQKRIPKKYWKRDYLAKAILEDRIIYLGGGKLTQIELLEKKGLVWDEKDQLLYVYRVGWEDSDDWEIAFSGPFPQDNQYSDFDFILSGSDRKTWTPQRQEELINEWIDNMGRDDDGNWME
jgi:uncharacterized protein YbaP (TraB family)